MKLVRIAATSALILTAFVAATPSASAQRFNDGCGGCEFIQTPSSPTASSAPVPQVCFYTQPNFGGNYYCESGLRRVNEVDPKWRDRIASVRVMSAEIEICPEFNRDGECTRLDENTSELEPGLFNHLYSFKIR